MTDINQAAKELRDFLGRPPWLSAIGVGVDDDHPVIVLYLVFTPKSKVSALQKVLDSGWEGHPVISRSFGTIAPMGSI